MTLAIIKDNYRVQECYLETCSSGGWIKPPRKPRCAIGTVEPEEDFSEAVEELLREVSESYSRKG